MKKFMKITVGIVAKLAFFAIVCATAYGVAHRSDTTGLIVLLGVALLGWIISGFFPDKQTRAYAELQANLKNASSTIAELQKLCKDSEAKEKATSIDRDEKEIELNKYHAAWEEATKREEMLHKRLREKQNEAEYWRNKYNQAVDSVVEEAVAETEPDDVEVATPAPEIARHRPIRKRRYTKPSKA